MDSGINKNHQDLKGKIVKDYNAINPGNENVDNYGHGTAVAGIIAAHDDDLGLTGISPNAEIYDVKVLDDKGLADIDTLILVSSEYIALNPQFFCLVIFASSLFSFLDAGLLFELKQEHKKKRQIILMEQTFFINITPLSCMS
ncbi:S8 family peptidase [Bacillus sp. B-TM1]